MKKILFVFIAVLFSATNYLMAATLNDGKEKAVDNIRIKIGDWEVNGKVNGKIYYSNAKELNDGRVKFGDCDAVTYSDGAIIINMDEEKIEQWVAELEDTFSDIEINGKRINSKDLDNAQSRITGSGNIITKTVPAITGYDAIKASRGINVIMKDMESDKITINADDNIMPYVVVRKEGSSLVIGIDKNIKSINRTSIDIVLPKNTNLNELQAASAATINIEPTIKSRSLSLDAASAAKINIAKADVDFFDADASSAATISGAVKSDDCYVDASSAADIDLTILAVQCKSNASSAAKIKLNGEVATFEGDASSAAKIEAKGLEVHTGATADASSGAKLTVNALKVLNANASSGGAVSYINNSNLVKNIKQSSGGRVKEIF